MKTLLTAILLTLLAVSTVYANDNFDFHYNEQRPGGDYTSFDVDNVDQCARDCENESRCQAFDFDTYERRCFLKDRVPNSTHNRDVISGVKHKRGHGHKNVPSRIAGLRIENDTKRNGGDYTNFLVNNLRECAQACSRDNKCQSFNYGKERRDCWLKHSAPNGVQNNTVISGVRERSSSGHNQARIPAVVDNMRLVNNTKRNGGDYTNFIVGNVEECARACARDNKCRSFNFGKERRDCWLKHSVPKGFHNNTVISGVKER